MIAFYIDEIFGKGFTMTENAATIHHEAQATESMYYGKNSTWVGQTKEHN